MTKYSLLLSFDLFMVILALNHLRHVLHKYANEDVSLGSWFIGLDVEHVDDRRLCCGTLPGKSETVINFFSSTSFLFEKNIFDKISLVNGKQQLKRPMPMSIILEIIFHGFKDRFIQIDIVFVCTTYYLVNILHKKEDKYMQCAPQNFRCCYLLFLLLKWFSWSSWSSFPPQLFFRCSNCLISGNVVAVAPYLMVL